MGSQDPTMRELTKVSFETISMLSHVTLALIECRLFYHKSVFSFAHDGILYGQKIVHNKDLSTVTQCVLRGRTITIPLHTHDGSVFGTFTVEYKDVISDESVVQEVHRYVMDALNPDVLLWFHSLYIPILEDVLRDAFPKELHTNLLERQLKERLGDPSPRKHVVLHDVNGIDNIIAIVIRLYDLENPWKANKHLGNLTQNKSINDFHHVTDNLAKRYKLKKIESSIDRVLYIHEERIGKLDKFISGLMQSVLCEGDFKRWIQVGVSTGACVDGILGETRRRYFMCGDAIETAKELEERAYPNTICVSTKVHKWILTSFGAKHVISTHWNTLEDGSLFVHQLHPLHPCVDSIANIVKQTSFFKDSDIVFVHSFLYTIQSVRDRDGDVNNMITFCNTLQKLARHSIPDVVFDWAIMIHLFRRMEEHVVTDIIRKHYTMALHGRQRWFMTMLRKTECALHDIPQNITMQNITNEQHDILMIVKMAYYHHFTLALSEHVDMSKKKACERIGVEMLSAKTIAIGQVEILIRVLIPMYQEFESRTQCSDAIHKMRKNISENKRFWSCCIASDT